MKSSLVYITDVFCPWCYGFAPILGRVKEETGLAVEVLCGNLVEEPRNASFMATPRGFAFFERLGSTTGRPVGQGFLDMLSGKGVVTDSSRSALLMAALKRLVPGDALRQMEAFQDAFYIEGLDVLSPEVQAKVAAPWLKDGGEELARLQEEMSVQESSQAELDRAEEILGDFVVYPTLYVRREDGSLHAVARGYADYDAVMARIEEVLKEPETGRDEAPREAEVSLGAACGLDGKCCR